MKQTLLILLTAWILAATPAAIAGSGVAITSDVTVDTRSSVSTLSGLVLSFGTLNPVFAAATLSYTASVANATTSVTITPTVTDSTATVKVNGTTVVSGVASGAISLVVGTNTITTVVTAQDGTTTKTYTVTVTRAPSAIATLSGIALSSGTLNPAFAAATISYTASVPNATTSITITPTVTDSTATVKVNETTVASGAESGSITLTVGTNTITTVVTAQDGTTLKTYTVTVTRISNVATLSGLVLSSGTLSPTFASETISYTASVPNATASITVRPTVTTATATVKVNGTTVASGAASGSITLTVGNNTITTVVTAQDGTTTSTYTVTVTRISNVSTLSGLVLSSGTLSPTFAAATISYTASVPNATTSITVRPTVTTATATVKVNGTTVASGAASGAISLTVGTNTITTVVTAQDGTTIKSYTVTVTRNSNVSTLAGMVLSSGTLSPTFAAATISYTASVPNATTSVTITPTVTDATATVKVNGTTVTSGTASQSIPLVAGTNTINVVVIAQDVGFTTAYTVTVTRPSFYFTYSSARDVPVSASSYIATGNIANLSLDYAPTVGTNLMLVDNTGLAFITGRFSNLAQGQVITLGYHNASYRFVVNYYGGTGNDLVLQWANDKAYAWGSNIRGQLGDSGVSVSSSNVPVAITASGVLRGKTILSISVGGSHSLALCGDGTLAAWGYNFYGQLGDGTNNDSNVPVTVNQSGVLADKTVVAVSAGFSHSLALCSDGTMVSWGQNLYSQLGNNTSGSATNSNVPVEVMKSGVLVGKAVTSMVAGYYHNLALCSDGTVVSWGRNNSGQLGNGGIVDSSVPLNITASGALNGRFVVTLGAGSDHSLVLCEEGSMVSWGKNTNGQLGDGTNTASLIPLDVDASDVLAGRVVEMISAGGFHNLAACSDGTLVAFGRNTNGQLGNSLTADSNMPVTVDLTESMIGKTVTTLQAANAHSLALYSDGTLVSWGSGSNGMLGNGGISNSGFPVGITASGIGSGEKFIALASGSSASHSIALTAVPLSSGSTLASLTLSSGTLSPTFAAGTFSYTATVSSATTSLTVTPTVTDVTATVTVNGVLVASGAASESIPLAVGSNTITLVGIPQDGVALSTYTVTVTRISNVSTLSSLSLSTGTLSPAFAPSTTTYTVSVPNATTSITMTPTVTDATATVKVNGTLVLSGDSSDPVQLLIGDNTITTVVTAQDEIAQSTYTLIVTRDGNYAAWKEGAFETEAQRNDSAISGPQAMPAHDGISNLMKYALALAPMTCGTADLPTATPRDGYLTLTYRKNKTANDVTYTVQVSDSLTDNDWSPAATVLTQTDPTPGGGTYWLVTVQDTVPLTNNPVRFMRLRVSQ